ncbi:MAG TPA: response regulator, partial [Phycisphaerales bacterium]|nr:response regulator [Phycisphaerales bacterium]
MVAEPHILIVEDESDISELIRFHVEREGFKAKTVHSGRIALDVIAREQPMLLVLDLMLPDLEGLEVCRRLKWDQETRHIPIL